ncbi:MAG: hypothetical protein AAB436_04125 [Patescibacteria group bacterium]
MSIRRTALESQFSGDVELAEAQRHNAYDTVAQRMLALNGAERDTDFEGAAAPAFVHFLGTSAFTSKHADKFDRFMGVLDKHRETDGVGHHETPVLTTGASFLRFRDVTECRRRTSMSIVDLSSLAFVSVVRPIDPEAKPEFMHPSSSPLVRRVFGIKTPSAMIDVDVYGQNYLRGEFDTGLDIDRAIKYGSLTIHKHKLLPLISMIEPANPEAQSANDDTDETELPHKIIDSSLANGYRNKVLVGSDAMHQLLRNRVEASSVVHGSKRSGQQAIDTIANHKRVFEVLAASI